MNWFQLVKFINEVIKKIVLLTVIIEGFIVKYQIVAVIKISISIPLYLWYQNGIICIKMVISIEFYLSNKMKQSILVPK